MNYKPLGSNVLLEVHKLEKKEKGIIIPDTASRTSSIWYGVVMSLGKEAEGKLNIGDKVFYNVHGAKPVDGEKLVIIDISDISCVFEEE
jgi:co-chaperonin GroES (HSP10)